ncbi:MAG: M3 family metallopeptidase [Desulfovibrionaceae bacterium]
MDDRPPAFVAPRDSGQPSDELPHWDLASLYAGPEDPALEADLDLLETEAACLGGARGGLDDPGEFSRREKPAAVSRRATRYVELLQAQGCDDPALRLRVEKANASLRPRLLGFDLRLGRLTALPPGLARFEPFFSRARRLAPSRLSTEDELAAAELDETSRQARLQTRTLASMRLGRPPGSVDQLRSRLASADPEERRRSAELLGRGLASRREILAGCLISTARARARMRRLRGLNHWLDETCLEQGLPPELVELAARAVIHHRDAARRFYDLKRRVLGLDTLHEHDRLAPWPGARRRFTWTQAVQLVLEAFDRASPGLGRAARLVLDGRRVLARPHPSGAGGPFCLPADQGPAPFVRLNFRGALHDVVTLAHELGHAAHHVLSAPQGPLQDTAAPVTAETMACLAEELLHQRLQDLELPGLVLHRLERTMTLVFRQTALLKLEAGMHQAADAGGLAPHDLDRLWRDARQEVYGESLPLGSGSVHDWALTPHFHFSPGYVAAYILGRLAAADLAARLARRPSQEQDLLKVMRQGLDLGAADQFRSLGLDPDNPGFIDASLRECSRLVSEAADNTPT